MHLTKFGHSCVRLTEAGRALVFDPGVFSAASDALVGADAVLLTHEHPDHIDVDALTAAAKNDAGLRIWAPASVARQLPGLSDVVTVVEPGEEFAAAGFGVRTYGGQHALIHGSVPVVANLGYLIDDAVYHPGDSFTVPDVVVGTVLVVVADSSGRRFAISWSTMAAGNMSHTTRGVASLATKSGRELEPVTPGPCSA